MKYIFLFAAFSSFAINAADNEFIIEINTFIAKSSGSYTDKKAIFLTFQINSQTTLMQLETKCCNELGQDGTLSIAGWGYLTGLINHAQADIRKTHRLPISTVIKKNYHDNFLCFAKRLSFQTPGIALPLPNYTRKTKTPR